MINIVIVGAGGFIGAVLRYWISGWAYQWWGTRLPYGTLAVNVLGSFLLGAFITIANNRVVISDQLRNFIAIGLLGALTTFSTFSFETVAMLQENLLLKAGLNIGLNLVFTLMAVWAGIIVGRVI